MNLIGKTIKSIRQMTDKEMVREGVDSPGTVIVFTDGDTLFALGDEEGNSVGHLIGHSKTDKTSFYVLGR